jgi:ATP-dependent DNA helicase RecQ
LEAYYQEAGRAGRDGKRSYALLIYEDGDIARRKRILESEFPPIEDVKLIYERIANYLQVPIGDAEGVSFAFNIYDFCAREQMYSGRVRSALSLLEQNGYMTFIDQNDEPAKMMFECSRDSLYSVHAGGNDMDSMLRVILRKYDGLFSRFRSISELEIAAESGLSAERVHELMRVLWRMRIIRYIPANNSPIIIYNIERLPTRDIYIAPSTYRMRKELMSERYMSMVEYVTASYGCRSRIIENYFGDSEATNCGVCDNCIKRRNMRFELDQIEAAILETIANREMDINEVVACIDAEPEVVINLVENLVGLEKISMTTHGKLKINS